MGKNRKHGESRTRLYGIWSTIKQRCYSTSHSDYYNYGGRGIGMCPEWRSDFLIFKEWAWDNGYSDGLTIDKIDNDKDYEPSNCRWIPMHEQFSNRRTNIIVTFRGETDTLTNMGNKYNLNHRLVRDRYKAGKSLEEVFAPVKKRKKPDSSCYESMRKAVVLTDKKTGERFYFKSVTEAENHLGVSRGQLSNVLTGKRKSTRGHYAEYQKQPTILDLMAAQKGCFTP